MIRKSAILCFCFISLAACRGSDTHESKLSCLENEPEKVAGLKVAGPRSEKNVIHNMWPVVCRARELYRQRLGEAPRLKGTLELKLTVEFNGEIGPYSVSRSPLEDEQFEAQLLRLVQFLDFDPFGPHNTETDILFPFEFKP
jgi:hypothetical protein